MQKEIYEIKKVKEYFLYAAYPQLIIMKEWMKNGNEVFERIENNTSIITRNNYISFFMISLFLLAWTIAVWTNLSIWFGTVVSFIIWWLAIKYFIKEIKKSRNFSQLQKYFSFKSPLVSFLVNFKKSINTDVFSEWINIVELNTIRVNMENITKVLSLITWPLIEFRKLWPQLPIEARDVLEKFIAIEVRWVNEYIREFREILTAWMEIHQWELSVYQKNELDSKNKEIFSLVSTRLTSHIEDIEKVRVHV